MVIISRDTNKAWWKSAVVYQIYPASFADSNGDGIGDLRGVTSKLDYLKDLGVDVVWLSPIFKSPQVDMGYDISDYRDIHAPYGTVSDVDELIVELHKRGMKLMLDLVINHTSDQHPWFEESRSSRTSPKRDWYIWRPATYDAEGKRHPPCNWKAAFGGSVWDWDEKTEEYYFHYYCPEQPDLNFENPDVRNTLWDMMKFWLDKGCDGYRMDVIGRISKDLSFPNVPIMDPSMPWQPRRQLLGPRVHEFVREMHDEVISKYDIMTVGELAQPLEDLLKFVHPDRREIQMAFSFDHVRVGLPNGDKSEYRDWTLREFKEIMSHLENGFQNAGAWHAIYLENHDQPRSISRYANDKAEWREACAKLLAMMHCTMWGTIYIYEGEEIGMINLPREWPLEDWKDVATQNRIAEIRNRGVDVERLTKVTFDLARDNARSPMQWNSEPHAGFTTGSPWMRVNDDYKFCNVAAQVGSKTSVLSFWKEMLALRKKDEDVLSYGLYNELSPEHERVYAYTRSTDDTTCLVMLNFTDKPVTYHIPVSIDNAVFVKSTYETTASEDLIRNDEVELRAYEGQLYRL